MPAVGGVDVFPQHLNQSIVPPLRFDIGRQAVCYFLNVYRCYRLFPMIGHLKLHDQLYRFDDIGGKFQMPQQRVQSFRLIRLIRHQGQVGDNLLDGVIGRQNIPVFQNHFDYFCGFVFQHPLQIHRVPCSEKRAMGVKRQGLRVRAKQCADFVALDSRAFEWIF